MIQYIWKKGIALSIMLLFSALFTPAAICRINEDMATVDDQIDQSQTEWQDIAAMNGMGKLAQSFRPTLNTLTRIEIPLGKFDPQGDISGYFTLSVKSSLIGEDLTSKSILVENLEDCTGYSSPGWVEFDFHDISVIPDETYYIVWIPETSWDDEGVVVCIGYYSDYLRGNVFEWSVFYPVWWSGEFGDMAFITYGYNSENQPPETPLVSGAESGKIGIEYTYTASTTDPDDDPIEYWFEWGDGTNTGWQSESTASYTWESEGDFTIKVKAMDDEGAESDWGELQISIPKTKVFNNPFIRYLENHPCLFPILRLLLL